ncbi:hypothetical protein ACFLZZ_02150 [Nanoarchaeota archaeon]
MEKSRLINPVRACNLLHSGKVGVFYYVLGENKEYKIPVEKYSQNPVEMTEFARNRCHSALVYEITLSGKGKPLIKPYKSFSEGKTKKSGSFGDLGARVMQKLLLAEDYEKKDGLETLTV